MKRTRVVAVMAVVAGLAFPAMAHAQTGYGSGTLTVSSTSLTFGQAFTASGGGYAPSSPVTVTFTSDPVVLANVTTNASGAFSVAVNVPANATAGQHTITASGKAPDNSARILTSTVTVTAAAAAGSGATGVTPLVRTGSSNTGPLLMWGVLLIAVGFLAVVAVRRNWFRRQHPSSS